MRTLLDWIALEFTSIALDQGRSAPRLQVENRVLLKVFPYFRIASSPLSMGYSRCFAASIKTSVLSIEEMVCTYGALTAHLRAK